MIFLCQILKIYRNAPLMMLIVPTIWILLSCLLKIISLITCHSLKPFLILKTLLSEVCSCSAPAKTYSYSDGLLRRSWNKHYTPSLHWLIKMLAQSKWCKGKQSQSVWLTRSCAWSISDSASGLTLCTPGGALGKDIQSGWPWKWFPRTTCAVRRAGGTPAALSSV